MTNRQNNNVTYTLKIDLPLRLRLSSYAIFTTPFIAHPPFPYES